MALVQRGATAARLTMSVTANGAVIPGSLTFLKSASDGGGDSYLDLSDQLMCDQHAESL